MIRCYKERLEKLREVLVRIAGGEFGPLTTPLMARRALEADEKLAERLRDIKNED